jgi:putative ABC transport system ATP-binding protein
VIDDDVTNSLIEVDGVSKTYRYGHGKTLALTDIHLRVGGGELVAIVGPSGAGKTTLVHIIGGLITPDEGEVRINGRRLSRRSDRSLSKYRNSTVGFIFQNFNLLPQYTAAENVMVPLIVAGTRRRKRARLAAQYLKIVGLENRGRHKATELSGGERQRVAIARALVNQPKIIIADEPTGSLDTARGLEIMNILSKLAHGHGMTILMVTHDEGLAGKADRIVHIRDGHVEEEHV